MIRTIKILAVAVALTAANVQAEETQGVMNQIKTQTQDTVGYVYDKLTTPVLSSQDIQCLARNIYYEAGSEPFEGKVAVAQVTLNRVNSGQFPNDVCKTIYQKSVVYEKVICQFSWACDRAVKFNPINKNNYDESMIAAQKVLLEDYRLPSLHDALYYHADYINPHWGKEKVAKIGHHIFYK